MFCFFHRLFCETNKFNCCQFSFIVFNLLVCRFHDALIWVICSVINYKYTRNSIVSKIYFEKNRIMINLVIFYASPHGSKFMCNFHRSPMFLFDCFQLKRNVQNSFNYNRVSNLKLITETGEFWRVKFLKTGI